MPSFGRHGPFIGLSLLSVLVVGAIHALRWGGSGVAPAAMIGIEHTTSFPFSIAVARLPAGRLVELRHGGTETIRVRVPSSWIRTEVRNAPLTSVTADEPAPGFTRWTLPPRATIVFQAPSAFEEVSVHNPSGIPLTARLTTVDVEAHSIESDARIVTEDPVVLPLSAD